MITEIERIGICLSKMGITINLKSDNLCLEIQDKLRKLNNDYNKTKFMLKVYKSKSGINNSLEKQTRREKADDTYKKEIIRLKKINNELRSSVNGLQMEIQRYKTDRINKIVYGSDSRYLKGKEYLI